LFYKIVDVFSPISSDTTSSVAFFHRYITDRGNGLLKGAKVSGIGPLGYTFFTDVEPTDYRTAATTDLEKTQEFWFNMLNNAVIPWHLVF